MTTDAPWPLLLDDPYPIYKVLRSSMPISWDEKRRIWLVARYADVLQGLYNRRLGSAVIGPAPQDTVLSLLPLQLDMSDPPDHSRRRIIIQRAIAERGKDDVLAAVKQTVSYLLARQFEAGRMDVIRELATPLTSSSLLRLFGFQSSESEEALSFSKCVNAIDACFDPSLMQSKQRPTIFEAARNSLDELEGIIEGRVNTEKPRLIQHLCDTEVGGTRLTHLEVIANVILLFAAGDANTRNLIGSGVLALACHPKETRRLKRVPEVIGTAVEEMLRYDSPIQLASRTALTDFQLLGQTVRKGDTVVLLLGSANRDELEFPHASDFDITRTPNHHLAFGAGAHLCLGAWLARAQARTAIRMLVAGVKRLHLAVSEVEWHQLPGFRGPKEVPIFFDLEPVSDGVTRGEHTC